LFKHAADAVKAEGENEIDIANVDIVWDRNFFRFRFDTRNPEYLFGSFEFTKEDERFNVSTYSYLSQEASADGSFDRLNDLVDSYVLPFEDYNMHNDCYEGEDFCTLTIDVWSDQLEELPSLKQINKELKKIPKKELVVRSSRLQNLLDYYFNTKENPEKGIIRDFNRKTEKIINIHKLEFA